MAQAGQLAGQSAQGPSCPYVSSLGGVKSLVSRYIEGYSFLGIKVQYLLENRSPPLVPSASPSTFAKRSRRFLDQN